jgi:amino acid transporter
MMGAGLYTLVGLASKSAGSFVPVAFVIAGVAALFSVYSYARLGARFPSRGGAAEFLLEEFGEGLVCGSLNVFQFLGYLLATSLYATGFAEYVTALAGSGFPSWAGHVVGAGVVIVFALVNLAGSRIVGRAETVIIAIESAILAIFVVLGAFAAEPSRLVHGGGDGLFGIVTASALLYVTYQGFGVVANAAGEMARPKTQLPRAMFAALGIVAVVYLLVSTAIVSVVPLSTITADAGHVLADGGRSVAGRAGFVVIAGAALLATASAVNATLFAASNIGYDAAARNQLTRGLTHTIWRSGTVALLVSCAAVVLLVLFFPLAAVGQMTSLAFLLIYGAVSAGHLRIRAQTGARAWPLIAAVVLNAALFVVLMADAIRTGPVSTWLALLAAIVGSVIFEAIYRRRTSVEPCSRKPLSSHHAARSDARTSPEA